jgi:hypothetical protein
MLMKFLILDYAEIFYRNKAGLKKPKRRAGKFVQIKHEDTEYLIFAPQEFTRYHADLVQKFCQDKGVDGSYNEQIKRYDMHDPSWIIIGGGKFEIDDEENSLRLYDNSMAYGRFDSRGLKKKILAVKKMSGYKVRIE